MNKQLEEMAKYVPRNITAYDGNPRGLQLYIEQRINIAEALYNAGYRRQEDFADGWKEIAETYQQMFENARTDVAREIFAEIEETAKVVIRILKRYDVIPMISVKTSCYEDLLGYISKLKKKYGVTEE